MLDWLIVSLVVVILLGPVAVFLLRSSRGEKKLDARIRRDREVAGRFDILEKAKTKRRRPAA